MGPSTGTPRVQGSTPAGTGAGDPGTLPSRQGKSKRLLLSLALAIVIAAGTAAFFYPKLVHSPSGVHNGPILQLGSSTLNLADGHILEVAVACQLTTAANQKAIDALEPRMFDAEISVFSNFTYPELLGLAGKSLAKAQLLKKLQAIVGTSGGYQQISEVYFTTFIMQ